MKKDFSICSKLERENFWFSLVANPVGCQNNYLLVPEGNLRKLFSFEKKLVFLKCGNWAKKTWPLAQFFSAGLTKLESTCLEEPFEKNFLKIKGFSFNVFGQRTKKVRPPGWNFSQRCQNIVLRVHKNNLRKLSSEVLHNFQILFAIEQEFCWTKQARGIAESCRKTLSSAKMYWRGRFDVSEKLLIRKTKHKSGITLFFQEFVVPQWKNFRLWDHLSVHASVWQRLHLRALKLKWWRIKKYKKWCDSERKEQFQGNKKKQSLSRATFLLHETPNKIRLIFFSKG